MSREDHLIEQLDRLLAPSTLDGTEGHAVLEELAATVRTADGDPLRIASALLNAKLRQRALLEGLVPRDAVNDAACAIAERDK